MKNCQKKSQSNIKELKVNSIKNYSFRHSSIYKEVKYLKKRVLTISSPKLWNVNSVKKNITPPTLRIKQKNISNTHEIIPTCILYT